MNRNYFKAEGVVDIKVSVNGTVPGLRGEVKLEDNVREPILKI
jgi:hypothetical protein